MSLADLFRCICKDRDCQQKDRIRWSSNGKYVHIRIDGCVIKSNEMNKCDCLILHFPDNTSKTIMFFIEFKPKSYSLSDVQKQIEKTVTFVESICDDIRSRVLVPVCYAESHSSSHHRFVNSYKVSSSKGSLLIKLLNYGEDIKKALK